MTISMRGGMLAALLCVAQMVTISAYSQANPPETPEAPAAQPGAPGQPAGEPGQPDKPAAPVALPPLPPPDPANFTASMPTKATVEAFLRASWGYDLNRIFQVQAIQKTQVDGISRVVVLVEEKGTQQTQPSELAFLTLPDGKAPDRERGDSALRRAPLRELQKHP